MGNLAYEHKKYTYEDIVNIDDDNRYEIIDGEIYLMSSPRRQHQLLLGELYYQIYTYLKGKKCKAFLTPLDVSITGETRYNKIFTIIQPDLMVICDTEKLEQGDIIFQVPDFIVEVLSPSSIYYDMVRKFNLYKKYGVKEYWIIDPMKRCICPYYLNKQNVYEIEKIYDITEDIKIKTLNNLKISLKDFYEENKNLLKKTDEEYVS